MSSGKKEITFQRFNIQDNFLTILPDEILRAQMRAVYVKLGQGVVLWSNILFDLITKFKKYIQEEVQGLRKP